MTVTFTTDLPDVDDLALDASVEDQLTSEPATTPSLNHGQLRHEYRTTGEETAWTLAGTTPYDAPNQVISGLLDGEKYDVRVRSETADVTGAWYEAAAVTLLPAPGTPTFPTVTETSVALAWTDNADNELEQAVRRQRSDFGAASEHVITTVAPDVTSATDDTVQPGRSYEYFVRTETEHVYADSPTASVSTTSTGAPQTQTRRSKWHVEIVLPSGEVLRPQVSGTPQIQPGDPQGDIMPRLDIPVPERPRWTNAETLVDEATEVRAWYDGAQLPIDEVVGVDPEPGQVTLRCRGASQLDRYIESLQVDNQETHLALRDLVDAETDYGRDIDDPASVTRSDVVMLSEGTGRPDDFREALAIDWPADSQTPTDDTLPLVLDGNGLRTRQTCFAYEAEDATGTYVQELGGQITGYDGEWSGGSVARLSNVGDNVVVNPDFQYTAPGVNAGFLFSVSGGSAPGLEISIDDEVVDSFGSGTLTEDAGEFDTNYFTSIQSSDVTGQATVEITVTESGGGDLYLDVVAVYDPRYTYDFPEGPDLAGRSDPDAPAPGPQSHPETYQIETIDVSSVQQVIAGRITADVDDTGGQQALAISNDLGSTWLEGTNTTDYSDTFASAGQQIRGRVTLSRHGTGGATVPAEGYQPTTVSTLEVRADLEDTPVLLDKQYSGPVGQIMTDMADSGDMVLQARRDPSAAWDDPTGITIESTVAGQRTRDRVPDQVVDYSASTTVEGSYDRIIVKGVSRDVTGETFTANTADALQGLDEEWIIPASETVTSTDGQTTFTRGDDYRIDWQEGAIEITSDGAMSAGTDYVVDYRWRVRGDAATPGVSNPTTRETHIPDATSQIECEQLALAILKRVQEPLKEAEVTVATSDPTVSLIAAFSYAELPFDSDEDLVLRGGMTVEPGRVTQRLGTRQSVGDVIEEIQSQFRAVAERV